MSLYKCQNYYNSFRLARELIKIQLHDGIQYSVQVWEFPAANLG
ncbi:hypothetical protein GCWU000282_01797 [Catonella morbi ATCC 51271]|uniref:Uncharacterized protein n=1 Tax=Catonella morbi ATCC 51271 TaxID=592026 RepID=V2Y5E9_9FIRM|nr:hypothetical protein GCWU000282_01797 [Catonella morbi ATCC 51271]